MFRQPNEWRATPAGARPARLIKLCDGADNYGGLVRNGLVESEPDKWGRIVRQHMEPMFSRLESVPFWRYAHAGASLTRLLTDRRELFWAAVERLLPRPTSKG
jgi:hypothetical protein